MIKAQLKSFAFILVILTGFVQWAAGQTPQFATIYEFGGVNAIPSAGLTLGPNGQLFGTTYGGAAADGTGSIYELTPKGDGTFAFKTLYRFDTAGSPANDGQYPDAGLTLSPDGTTLYGTTQKGGSGGGVLFSLNIAQSGGAAARPSSLRSQNNSLGYGLQHAFNGTTEGGGSDAPLRVYFAPTSGAFGEALAILFGTLSFDGKNNGGEVFSFDPKEGSVNEVHAMSGSMTDAVEGFGPQGGLAVAANGRAPGLIERPQVQGPASTNLDLSTITLYGITKAGGSNHWGTVYSVTANGSNYMVLHHFNLSSTDGAGPLGGVVLSANALYGTTSLGGNNSAGTVFKINTDGSGFQIIEHFDFASTGYSPQGDLLLSGDTLYGTTHAGGANGGGTVYSIDTRGSNFTVLHSFSMPVSAGSGAYTNSDGGLSVAGLLLADNTLYGTTPYGGSNGVGTAYAIVLPPPPSLKIAHTGSTVQILWPSSLTNYVLQSAAAVSPLAWTSVSGSVKNDGTSKSVSLAPTEAETFFRLFSSNTNGP
jgi:uncharacterized repeat protein (TIGR03803 family)